MGNHLGAIRSFEKIRDAAEDIGDCFKEVTAYYQVGLTLKRMKNYNAALNSFKRMLQVAWNYDLVQAELHAYEMIGRSYFHLGNV